jgi:D-amino peptidase
LELRGQYCSCFKQYFLYPDGRIFDTIGLAGDRNAFSTKERIFVNVYILTDMEGVSLVTEWEQVQQGHPFYPKYQQVLTDEVNAAVEGALAAGAERIVINDGHGSKDYNLLWDRLNRKAEIERPDSATNILPSLQKDFAAMILIGYHSMEGTPDAVLAHTQSHTNIRYYEVNGQRFGEIAQMSLIAGHFGVPVAYMSGDRAAVAEARSFLGDDLPATVVKWGHANGKAVSLHPAESAAQIRRDVERALKLPRRQAFTVPGPYQVTICYKSEELAARRAKNPDVRQIDDFTVCKTVLSAKDILS